MEHHPHPHNHNKTCHHPANASAQPTDIQTIQQKWISYKPLIIIVVFCLLLPLAQNYKTTLTPSSWMYDFMGYFLIFLSLFKFFDLHGFVDGFATYDLITKKFRPYGYAYPFIELFLGLAYLAQFHLFLTNSLTFVIMTVSGLGVMQSVFSGQKIKCACLGTVLNVPLGTVSILENLGMSTMAAYHLIFFR